MASLLRDVRAGLHYVWSQPVLRSISLMMALINFVASTESSQLVLFAKRVLGASDSEVALLFAAGALAGAAAIQVSGNVAGVYAATGALTALIALSFAFSPVAHGDRFLAAAAGAAPAGEAAVAKT